VSVDGIINGHHFRATLEPDGQASHWLKVSRELQGASGVGAGDTITPEVAPVEHEPEPMLLFRSVGVLHSDNFLLFS
jgi:hypothetical protein